MPAKRQTKTAAVEEEKNPLLKTAKETDEEFILRLFSTFAQHKADKPKLLVALQERLNEVPLGREQEAFLNTLDTASSRMMAIANELRLEVRIPHE